MSIDTFSATEVFSSVDIAGDSHIQLRVREETDLILYVETHPPDGEMGAHVFRATPKGIADATALATALLDWASAAKTKTNPEPPPTEGDTP